MLIFPFYAALTRRSIPDSFRRVQFHIRISSSGSGAASARTRQSVLVALQTLFLACDLPHMFTWGDAFADIGEKDGGVYVSLCFSFPHSHCVIVPYIIARIVIPSILRFCSLHCFAPVTHTHSPPTHSQTRRKYASGSLRQFVSDVHSLCVAALEQTRELRHSVDMTLTRFRMRRVNIIFEGDISSDHQSLKQLEVLQSLEKVVSEWNSSDAVSHGGERVVIILSDLYSSSFVDDRGRFVLAADAEPAEWSHLTSSPDSLSLSSFRRQAWKTSQAKGWQTAEVLGVYNVIGDPEVLSSAEYFDWLKALTADPELFRSLSLSPDIRSQVTIFVQP